MLMSSTLHLETFNCLCCDRNLFKTVNQISSSPSRPRRLNLDQVAVWRQSFCSTAYTAAQHKYYHCLVCRDLFSVNLRRKKKKKLNGSNEGLLSISRLTRFFQSSMLRGDFRNVVRNTNVIVQFMLSNYDLQVS